MIKSTSFSKGIDMTGAEIFDIAQTSLAMIVSLKC